MTFWEYETVFIHKHNMAQVMERLNEMGKDGWELVSIDEGRAYLKREVDESPVLLEPRTVPPSTELFQGGDDA